MAGEPPSSTPSRQTSRVLAALDDLAFNFDPATSATLDSAPTSSSRYTEAFKRPLDPAGVSALPQRSRKLRRTSGVDVSAEQENLPRVPLPGFTGILGIGASSSSALQELSELVGSQSRAGPSSSARGPSLIPHQFNLNYDRETSISHIDVGGEDQHVKMAEFVSRTIDNASHGIKVRDAMEKLDLHEKTDVLPGMEVRLLPHQIIGVSWMLDQELKSPHKGGILADDMGLGKTVQMIATMAMNLPEENEKHKTTLIVVPAALLLQWKEELLTRTNAMFSVHIHHGREKLKSLVAMQKKDVIVTTYQTLVQESATPDDVASDEEAEWLVDNGGLLAQMKWYRVVLDEAQFVRNRKTASSRAVALLRSKYRWCLTGTPITNTLADIYGFLRFGRFRPWNDWIDFNEYIAKVQLEDAPLAGLRAQEVLRPLLLRRTKNSELEGKPLLELPEKHIDLVELEFSEEEREIYDQFERRAQICINRFIRDNTVVKNHTFVLVMILRLRQLCGHPNLILSQADGFEDPSLMLASDADKEVGRAAQAMGSSWVTEVKRRFVERARAAQRWEFTDEMDEPEGSCPKCGDLIVGDNGRLLSCGHEICSDCLDDIRNAPPAHDNDFGNNDEQTNMKLEKEYEIASAKGLRPCPTCKRMLDLRPSFIFLSSAFEPSRDDVRDANRRARDARIAERDARRRPATKPAPSKRAKYEVDIRELSDSSDDDLPDPSQLLSQATQTKDKGKGRAPAPARAGSGSEDDGLHQPNQDMIRTWRRGDDNLEPSAKMLALVELLQEWDTSGDKVIVFSQWTSMLDLLEMMFPRYGIRNLRYDGSMDRVARETVLKQFRKTGGPKVILISTKCGGVGLNLVSANRVVNMDLSWNWASESQAYDRVHRLGQEKEVFVKRLVVRNTIEERMLKLQETKVGLAEAALGEGSGVKLHKLSVKEIKDLFGMNKNDNPSRSGSQNPS
ncbi:hypothetical protein CERSUDRAFT_143402 [Gelatoporia subvermispora B]|uniref:Uncharacterized protein n=1 Tax=Ceriporiopsis subvermispora (strain B) TaxID=914234 RepID=M2R1P9_CERS8|nr:hypothetical protein CERSUDRAFT_143402 [Gelatoporia subvermispora B]